MKILITGGNGFIGSHLVNRLSEQQRDVIVLDLKERSYDSMPQNIQFIQGDLMQDDQMRKVLIDVDIVVHLAWATIHEKSNKDPTNDIIVNLVPTLKLINLALQTNVKRFVFMSSGGTVYGPALKSPIEENHPKNPINAYGINKLSVENYLQMFNHLYGMDYAILRPSVPYGPLQNPLSRQGAVSVFLYRIAKGLPLDIWGDRNITRDYFHVSNLIDAIISVLDVDLKRERIFNVGGSEEISLNLLVKYIEKTVSREAQINYHKARDFDVSHLMLNTTRAAEHLNWSSNIPIKEGLLETWEWMSETFNI